MRLICPNCGAQYEVDPQVIPDTGRDVQCSNCGNTWFQRPAAQDAELAAELGFSLPDEDVATPAAADVRPDPVQEAADDAPLSREQARDAMVDEIRQMVSEDAPEPDQPDDAFDPMSHDAPFDAPDPEPQQPPVARRQPHDESILSILREEAQIELARRAETGEPLETQSEFALNESESAKTSALRARMARLRGQPEFEPPSPPAQPEPQISGKRRDLLPDIEEINSTLRSSAEREDDGSVAEDDVLVARAKRSSFRVGFGVILGLVVALLVLYVLAPMIAKAVPAATPALEVYVTAANGVRGWFNSVLAGATSRLSLILAQISGAS